MTQERNYPWDVLAIDETDNKKLIKKAYAVLIKQYKPDEYPNKFQEIQEAYQYALNILKWEDQEESQSVKTQHSFDDFTLNENASNHEINLSDEETAIINNILEKTEKLLKSELTERENIHNWKFLEQSNQILDIKTREIFSQQLFALISKYNLMFYKHNKRMLLSSYIFHYINDYVDWNDRWKEYSFIFNSEELQLMYIALEGDDKKVQFNQVNFSLRFRAFFSDITISYLFAAYFYYFKDYTFTETLMLTFKIFVLYRLIIELLFRQSIGKLNRNIFIADKIGNNCTRIQTLTRHLIINLTLTPFYVWSFNIPIDSKIWIGIFCTMVFFHLLSILNSEKLFHDTVTKTILFHKEHYL